MNEPTPTDMYWWNYATRQYDLRGAPTTDKEAQQYIPQSVPSQGIYQCRRALGDDVLTAMRETLEAHIPLEMRMR